MEIALVMISVLGAALTAFVLLLLQSKEKRDDQYRAEIRASIHQIRSMVQPLALDVAVIKAKGDMAEVLRDGFDRLSSSAERRDDAMERMVAAIERKAANG